MNTGSVYADWSDRSVDALDGVHRRRSYTEFYHDAHTVRPGRPPLRRVARARSTPCRHVRGHFGCCFHRDRYIIIRVCARYFGVAFSGVYPLGRIPRFASAPPSSSFSAAHLWPRRTSRGRTRYEQPGRRGFMSVALSSSPSTSAYPPRTQFSVSSEVSIGNLSEPHPTSVRRTYTRNRAEHQPQDVYNVHNK